MLRFCYCLATLRQTVATFAVLLKTTARAVIRQEMNGSAS